MSELYYFRSPAKINLHLSLINRRNDGFHNLELVNSRISLFDEIYVRLFKGNEIEIVSNKPEICSEEQLLFKIVLFLKEKWKIRCGIQVFVKKSIPVGSGLGGASSNAASLLRQLAAVFGEKLDYNSLPYEISRFGADIPFFLFDKPAFVEGIGEKITLFKDFPRLHLVIVMAELSLITKNIFSLASNKLTIKKIGDTYSAFKKAIENNDNLPWSLIKNDFETAVFEKYPEVAFCKNLLLKNGARASLMSGTGSAVFGIFDTFIDANNCIQNIHKSIPYIRYAKTID